MKILWVTNIPSPYRVDFFNELGKYLDLTVLFERSTSSERHESWRNYEFNNFQGILLKSVKWGKDKAISISTLKFIFDKKYSHIIVSNPLTPTGIFTIELLRLLKKKYYIVSDGGIPKEGNNLKERFKKHIFKNASLYFSTAKIHDEYYMKYGAIPERIVRYPFTSLKNNDILKETLKQKEINALKKELGIKGEKVILSVGRFAYEKGYDILIKACKSLDPNIEVYIVGGKPTEEYKELIKEMNINNIHFIEFKTKSLLSKYYKIANLFVLPTRGDVWGLVINEAMAKGLPVITTEKCVAGLELIKDGDNGFIIPSESPSDLYEKMNLIINSNSIASEMSLNNIEKIRNYTIEEMARLHIEIFKESYMSLK